MVAFSVGFGPLREVGVRWGGVWGFVSFIGRLAGKARALHGALSCCRPGLVCFVLDWAARRALRCAQDLQALPS